MLVDGVNSRPRRTEGSRIVWNGMPAREGVDEPNKSLWHGLMEFLLGGFLLIVGCRLPVPAV